jgi:molecular chaperone DnaJ
MQFHPDRNKSPEAEEKFKEISEAYAVLSDDEKRQQYNNLGHAGFDQRYTQEDIYRGADFDVIGDLIKNVREWLTGGMGRGGQFRDYEFDEETERGQDIQVELSLTLEEAAKGVEKEFQIPRTEKCNVCGGTGASPGTSPKPCPRCKGSGRVQHTVRTPFGVGVTVTTCPTCRGKGTVVDIPCKNCQGTGLVRKQRKIAVKIPAGIQDRKPIRLRGEGEINPDGGEPGDLYVIAHVLPNELFMREGDDLFHVLIISYPQAALGGNVTVPTLDGPTTIKIQPGTQSGATIRLDGKGMPHFRGDGRGDLLIRVSIAVPEKLTSQQRVLLEQLSKEFGDAGKPRSHRFRL